MDVKIFNEHNVTPVMFTVFGSHLYGLSTESSDTDYKGIYIPNRNDWLLGTHPKSINQSTGDKHKKNSNQDVDIGLYSIQKFVSDSLKGETHAIDMLHADKPLLSSDIWKFLLKNRQKFYSKNMKSFIGYAAKQADKYGVKGSRMRDIELLIDILSRYKDKDRLELFINDINILILSGDLNHSSIDWNENEHGSTLKTIGKRFGTTTPVVEVINSLQKTYDVYGERAKLAKENKGVDFKAVSHALRAAYQQRDIFKYGDFEYPLKESDFILKVKKGELNFLNEIQPVLEDLIQEVNNLSDSSMLEDEADKPFWDYFLIDVFYSNT